MTVGSVFTATLLSADGHGNACLRGGAPVSAAAVCGGTDGRSRVEAAVTDHGDGSYTLAVAPTAAGDWAMRVAVGGQPVPAEGAAPGAEVKSPKIFLRTLEFPVALLGTL